MQIVGATVVDCLVSPCSRGILSMSGGIEEVGSVKWELLLCLLACWVACYFCIWKGVRFTGKVVYFTAVFPYVMLAILLVRGLTLPGAWQGVVYYLYPDPSRLADFQVWMEAAAQVLFSYGVSSGALITLGSYNKIHNNCYKDSLWLCVLNSATSFISGFVVFSTLGFMAEKQGISIDKVADSGPGLAFVVFPQAVALMPLPQLWAACFFLMLILLGLDTLFAGLETIISSVIDMFPGQMRRPWRREIVLFFFCSISFIIQISLTTQVCFFGFFLNHQPLTTSGGYMYPDWAYSVGWAMALSSVVAVPIWAHRGHPHTASVFLVPSGR
ncbi:sodium- and chloride-dependent betaine transporter-like isoform X2 [Pseudoliparis swirei]|uniref:sodium- and chloride-dependent betaine transporter-like isoform X2 n=1 Tax=Pseudoliparis swirei TaxID=2059687 RepID=UPI0024BE817F|nr:sodium- and chloride-dependent betaine transporter-like isoform X2 [Pseudoliparis swirei]